AVVGGHVSRPPDLSMLPEEERPIVARALAKRPQRRWPSCGAFVDALDEPRLTRRTWIGVSVGTIAAGAVYGLATIMLQQQSSARLVAKFRRPSEKLGRIRGLAFSQDARFVVTNSSDGQPWVWNFEDRVAWYSLPTAGGPGVAMSG